MKVIEIALFQLKPNTTEDQVQAALRESDNWLERQPGFVRRHHGTNDEGRIDLVEWDDLAAAKAAAEQFMSAPEARALMAIIEPETVVMRHFELLS